MKRFLNLSAHLRICNDMGQVSNLSLLTIIMDYNETLKYINNTPKFSKILGNDDLKKLLNRLGNPQNELSFIHIAGTNGKGSVSAMTAKILETAGYKTGLFTSPFIEVFNERIQINGENIPDDALAKIATRVKTEIDDLGVEISVFAQITAMAFLYFYEEKCDFVVLETGLGGRLDATNVILSPKICAITKIGLDHTEWLGDTLEKITAEKCGIIKPGTMVVTCGNQDESVIPVIANTCKNVGVPLFCTGKYSGELGLLGDYQKSNAAMAQKITELLGICEKDIKQGLADARWIARFEFLRDNLIIDGGHNPDGVRALISSLKKLSKDVIFVVAMMEDKDIAESCKMIRDFAASVIITRIDMPRCASIDALCAYFPDAHQEKSCIKAVEYALSSADKNQLVCVCGSLYLAGEIRRHFKA